MPFAHTNSGYLKTIGPSVLFEMVMVETKLQGPRSKFSSGGAKEESVKENFGGGPGGGMLVDFYSISLK